MTRSDYLIITSVIGAPLLLSSRLLWSRFICNFWKDRKIENLCLLFCKFCWTILYRRRS